MKHHTASASSSSNTLAMTVSRRLIDALVLFAASIMLVACGGSGSAQPSVQTPGGNNRPVISAFSTSSTSIASGTSATLSWATTGATSVSISPTGFTSNKASDQTTVAPTSTTTYTLTATNSAGSTTPTLTTTVTASGGGSVPGITSFSASQNVIAAGASDTLSWATTGATSVSISPTGFTSNNASGSTTVAPTSTTTYTLTATNGAGSVMATVTVTVQNGSSGGSLAISTTSCPAGTQGAAYVGCNLVATGGTPPYVFSVSSNTNYPPLPEGLSLDPATGAITGTQIGGQGTYSPLLVVTDSASATASVQITFAIAGSNAFLSQIFPSTSIFHHRVDAATTSLPVDTSPAAPIYTGYQGSKIHVFFGNASAAPFPNGIPAFQVPYNQPNVAVSTSVYQSYFSAAPIPANAPVEGTSNSTGDRHVLVYVSAGGGKAPALYEMWEGIYQNGPWTDSSNALWSDVTSNALTPQGNGTTDAAGLPVAPLVVNADEVIGSGTPAAPNGSVQHPIRFTLNHMLNYWVWPATQTAGVGTCTAAGGGAIAIGSLLSQSAPPASCSMSNPAGEIYRLKATVATPACATSSPQAAIIITGFRNYGIILADNGISGGLIGTPDARWNDADLACLTQLTLADFEPVNVSSLMTNPSSGATSH